jgi:hypothetical protein
LWRRQEYYSLIGQKDPLSLHQKSAKNNKVLSKKKWRRGQTNKKLEGFSVDQSLNIFWMF